MSDPNLDKIKITSDNLLCEPIKEERDMKGLAIPQEYESKVDTALVIKAGENCKIPTGVKVWFNRYASISLEIGDKSYLVLKDEDVVCYKEK